MNKYHQKIMEITELANIPKEIDERGMAYLRERIRARQFKYGTTDVIELLPFIVRLVYNESYSRAIQDVLDILRKG